MKRGAGEALRYSAIARAGVAALALLLGACSPRLLIVRNVADQLATQGRSEEDDLLLARDAAAFYLEFSESVLRQDPGHLPLAEAVAGGFTRYAYAFVGSEAERLEAQDTRAARRLRERAARLYRRAHRHAMAALEQHQPGFAQALASPSTAAGGSALQLSPDEVGVAYWAAASWGACISLSKDDPEVVADLPLAIRLAGLAWAVQPDHGNGALASLMGTFELARPGGSRRQAEAYFDRAIAAGAGRHAAVYVAKAESLALPAGDRGAYDALLHQALVAGAARRDLGNAVMSERAQWLLDTADDRF